MADVNGLGNGRLVMGIGGLLSVFAFVMNLYIAPIKELSKSNSDAIIQLQIDIRRISDLAVERGALIPSIQADIKDIKSDIRYLRESISGGGKRP